jgi:hypothetical protein
LHSITITFMEERMMLDHELSAIDLYLAVGLMGCIADLQARSVTGKAAFGTLRDSTRLLPEKLVAAR